MSGRGTNPGTILAVAALCCVAASEALAQTGPFGVGAPEPAMTAQGGLLGWIAAQQSGLYQTMSGLVRSFHEDPSAGLALVGISFLYGVLHAAGPGHGKAVISGYLVATRQSARRGVALSFISSLVQAMTAIALVGVFSILLRTTSMAMADATRAIETASFALVTAIGAWLVATKGRALAREFAPAPAVAIAGHHHHDHSHGHGCACCHGPDPAALSGEASIRKAVAAVVAVGLRPCTGAVLVLVFAAAQGVFALGVASAFAMALGTGTTVALLAGIAVGARGFAARLAEGGSGWAMAALRAVELLAALAVLAIGLLLLLAAVRG